MRIARPAGRGGVGKGSGAVVKVGPRESALPWRRGHRGSVSLAASFFAAPSTPRALVLRAKANIG